LKRVTVSLALGVGTGIGARVGGKRKGAEFHTHLLRASSQW